jgi:hypothetical protein
MGFIGMEIVYQFPFMKIRAITFWKGIVSPLYDAAESILLVFPEGKRETVHVGRMSIFEKNEVLEKSKVHILICGAISNLAHADLVNKEIEVIPWIRGPVEEVLQAHCLNKLAEGPFLLPGCRGARRSRVEMQKGGKKTRRRHGLMAVSKNSSCGNLRRRNSRRNNGGAP